MANKPSERDQFQQLITRFNQGETKVRDDLLVFAQSLITGIVRKNLHRTWAALQQFEQTDDVVNDINRHLLEKTVWARFWNDPPIITRVEEFYCKVLRLIKDHLRDRFRHFYGRNGQRPTPQSLEPGADEDGGARHDLGTDTHDPQQLAQWTAFFEQVEKLDEDLQAVFEQVWLKDKTQVQAAQELGICERTVRERWLKVRLELHAALGDGPFDWMSFQAD